MLGCLDWLVMGVVFPPHVPEDHRQGLFAGLGDEYGSVEERSAAELWLSVAQDECVSCSRRLVWRLAKDAGAVVVVARAFKVLVTLLPVPEGNREALVEAVRLCSVEDRAEMMVEVANDFAVHGHRAGHGEGCGGCDERRTRWEAVRLRAITA